MAVASSFEDAAAVFARSVPPSAELPTAASLRHCPDARSLVAIARSREAVS